MKTISTTEGNLDITGRVSDALFQEITHQPDATLHNARTGESWLDVGCGGGEITLALARLVGGSGHVAGVDVNASQIRRARSLAVKHGVAAEFAQADAHALPFADGSFDGVRADRVFQHLQIREQALAEMIRVVRIGGWICVADPDWDTLVIDSPHRAMTRKVVAFLSDRIHNGWSGRQLPRLFKQAGLSRPTIIPGSLSLTDLNLADELYGLRAAAQHLLKSGDVMARDVGQWIASLDEANATGCFFCCLTGFSVCARKPG
jgi:ubiquinone/menaquinone biosynthesis C-methylase UbiE